MPGMSASGLAPRRLDGANPDVSVDDLARNPATNRSRSRPFGTRILFLDGRMDELPRIIAGAAGRLTIVLLDANSDGIAQMAHHLRGSSGIDTVMIATCDEAASLSLGSANVTVGNLYAYEDELRRIGAALAPGGRVRLLGRGLRSDRSDQPLLIMLSRLMEATVEASPEPAWAIPWEEDGAPCAHAAEANERRVA